MAIGANRTNLRLFGSFLKRNKASDVRTHLQDRWKDENTR